MYSLCNNYSCILHTTFLIITTGLRSIVFCFVAVMYLRFLCAIYMTEHLCVYFCSMHVEYTSDPQNVPFCENQPVPTMFTVTCQYNSTIILPSWVVTGLASMPDPTIIRPEVTRGPFIPQGRALPSGVGESTLTVNSQEVTVTTCFKCLIQTIDSRVFRNFRSNQGCVTVNGQ